MRLTDAQYGALDQINQFGPKDATEVLLPPGMDGKHKIKLVCHFMTHPTLARLEQDGLVNVSRGDASRPKDAAGRRGHARRSIAISITEKGRAVLQSSGK